MTLAGDQEWDFPVSLSPCSDSQFLRVQGPPGPAGRRGEKVTYGLDVTLPGSRDVADGTLGLWVPRWPFDLFLSLSSLYRGSLVAPGTLQW